MPRPNKGKDRVRAPREDRLHEKLQATFFLVRVEPRGLDEIRVREFLSKLILLIGPMIHEEFEELIIFVEDRRPTKGVPEVIWEQYPIPCRVMWVKPATPAEVLAQKLLHETKAYREPGHKSTVAPKFLTDRTCVFVLGDLRFLMDNIDLYLERTGAMRRQLIELLKTIAVLREASAARPTEDSYVRVSIYDGKFYPGNFNALYDQILRARGTLTTEDVLERLSPRSPVIDRLRGIVREDEEAEGDKDDE